MADVRPFAALRFADARVPDLASVVSAPYDIISPAEQRDCYARSEHNVVRLEFGLDEPNDSQANNRYTRAGRTLDLWRSSGILTRDAAPAMYVLDETFSRDSVTRTRRSLVARVRLAEWSEGIVLPHERTMAKPKADRLSLLRATGVQFSPLLVLYDDPTGTLHAALAEVAAAAPVADLTIEPDQITEAATRQRLWRAGEDVAHALGAALRDRPLVIADGHHRYETALAYRAERRAAEPAAGPDEPFEFAMMHLVDVADPGIVVLPTHRLLAGFVDLDLAELRARWEQHFDVVPIETPTEPERAAAALRAFLGERRRAGQVAFGVAGLAARQLHALILRSLPAEWREPPSWRSIDVGILHGAVVDRLPGMGFWSAPELTFSRDAVSTIEAVWSGRQQLAFFPNPTEVRSILEVARAGDRMPEKSTYFSPKPVTGLAMYDLRG